MNRIGGQFTDGVTKAIDDFLESSEDFVSEALFSEFFPNLLDGIHLRRVRRDVEQHNILRYSECLGFMPRGAVAAKQDDIVCVLLG